jgi:hypothetical protein
MPHMARASGVMEPPGGRGARSSTDTSVNLLQIVHIRLVGGHLRLRRSTASRQVTANVGENARRAAVRCGRNTLSDRPLRHAERVDLAHYVLVVP